MKKNRKKQIPLKSAADQEFFQACSKVVFGFDIPADKPVIFQGIFRIFYRKKPVKKWQKKKKKIVVSRVIYKKKAKNEIEAECAGLVL
jgi:hypothetical protein